jgi:hypothetical protein
MAGRGMREKAAAFSGPKVAVEKPTRVAAALLHQRAGRVCGELGREAFNSAGAWSIGGWSFSL